MWSCPSLWFSVGSGVRIRCDGRAEEGSERRERKGKKKKKKKKGKKNKRPRRERATRGGTNQSAAEVLRGGFERVRASRVGADRRGKDSRGQSLGAQKQCSRVGRGWSVAIRLRGPPKSRLCCHAVHVLGGSCQERGRGNGPRGVARDARCGW